MKCFMVYRIPARGDIDKLPRLFGKYEDAEKYARLEAKRTLGKKVGITELFGGACTLYPIQADSEVCNFNRVHIRTVTVE